MLLARSHSLIKLRRHCSSSVFIRSLTVCSSSLLNNPSTSKPYFQNTAECPQFHFMFPRYFSSKTASSSSKQSLPLTRDGNYNEASPENLVVCPGCGVHMQDADPKHPGFFVKPSQKDPRTYRLHAHLQPVCQESEVSDFLKRGTVIEPETNDSDVGVAEVKHERPVVCARCHSLRHYGKVKDSTVENLLPNFDFDHTIGRKLVSTSGTRSVVLMVVDASDFDGSFPKKVANLVSDTIEEHSTAWKLGKSGNVPRVVLVCCEDWGLKNLVDDVIALAGQRGNVWAIGAQNAGKSTLINSLGKHVGGKVSHLTEAPVPGTTLGIVRVEGVLPRQAKLFDTPGLLHPHQIATRLTREEQKLVYISKELKPRTYRIKPPIGKDRVKELGQWVRKEFHVCGNSWDSTSVDISAAGLGWFAIGLKGEAQLGVWTYDGIDVVLRNSLIPQRSQYFEVSGFTVSKIVSKADQSSNKALRQSEKKKPSNRKETTPANAEPVS
uniref:G domain-containing protein n=1 Tax=Cannabis sativa TaxID=3483 RepID=A0A803PYX2_CANSA